MVVAAAAEVPVLDRACVVGSLLPVSEVKESEVKSSTVEPGGFTAVVIVASMFMMSL